MAQSTITHDRYDLSATGDNVRESLADFITNISPTETPLQMRAARGTASSNKEEWLLDSLAAAAANSQIDGDEFSNTTLNAAERVGNFCQISWKVLGVSRRAEKLTKAGRKSEVAYQLAKLGKELKRDKEYALTGGGGMITASAGTATVSGKLAPLSSWIRSNTDRAAMGTDPTLSSTTYGTPVAGTDQTDRKLTENEILALIKSAYVAGGNPGVIMCGPTVKQVISKYLFSSNARVATAYQDFGKKPGGGLTAAGSYDFWVSDFGTLEIIPNRFQREDDVYILDMDMWEVRYIDDMKVEDLARTGDGHRKALICDYTLCSKQEAASAIFADCDETLAMTSS